MISQILNEYDLLHWGPWCKYTEAILDSSMSTLVSIVNLAIGREIHPIEFDHIKPIVHIMVELTRVYLIFSTTQVMKEFIQKYKLEIS